MRRIATSLLLCAAAAAANAQTAEYRQGWDAYLRQDYPTAIRLLVIAADAGDADAATALADIHERGLGTAKDPQQAAQWRRLAQDQGGGKTSSALDGDDDPDFWKKRALDAEKRDWAAREELRKQEEARKSAPRPPSAASRFSWGYSIGGPRYYDPFWGPGLGYGYGPGWGPRWGYPHSGFGFGFSQGFGW